MKTSTIFSFAAILLLSLVIYSCEDTTEVGSGLLGEEDLEILFTDQVELQARTVPSGPIATFFLGVYNVSRHLVGEVTDQKFGNATSGVYVETNISAARPDYSGATFDSITLSIQFLQDQLYGDPDESLRLDVFRLLSEIDNPDSIFSNEDFMTEPEPLATIIDYIPSEQDSVIMVDFETGDTVVTSGMVTFRLPNEIGEQIISDTLLSESTLNFRSFFPGIYVTANGGNSLLALNLVAASFNNAINVYFTDDEGEGRVYRYPLFGSRPMRFTHDYTGSTIGAVLDSMINDNDLLYVQGMAGVNVEVDLSGVNELNDPFVNLATLEFFVAEDYHQDYYKGENLLLTRFGPIQQKNAYKRYRKACGRDERLIELWGKEAFLN